MTNPKQPTAPQSVFHSLNGAIRTYRALTRLNHDHVDYAVGSEVELTPEQAAPLLDVQAVELVK